MVTATISVLLLLFFVGVVFSMRGVQETGTADLAAKIASDHFQDSMAFYNATIQDAILDGVYITRQCGLANDPCAWLGANLPTYLVRSSQNLSSPSISSANSSPVLISCPSVGVEGVNGESMQTFTFEFSTLVDVNNSAAEYRRQPLSLAFRAYSFYSSSAPAYHRLRLLNGTGTYSSSNEFYNLWFSCP